MTDKCGYSSYQVPELCESRGGRPGLPSLTNLRFLWTLSNTSTNLCSIPHSCSRPHSLAMYAIVRWPCQCHPQTDKTSFGTETERGFVINRRSAANRALITDSPQPPQLAALSGSHSAHPPKALRSLAQLNVEPANVVLSVHRNHKAY